ncbi:MAG: hypothetical protein K9L85_01675 [Candidatus Peribacteraceae bacterium]|nr:hypothetical protein [Candidatus Peribacteraceae bacterium]
MSNAVKFWHEKSSPEIENSARKRENPAHVKKKNLPNRKLIVGIMLACFASLILGTVGFFLFQKYSRPDSIANILPADDTLFFAELQLDEQASALSQTFQNENTSEIFGLDSLGLPDVTSLIALAENRISVAFFGDQIDPQNFALIFSISDESTVIDFFENSTLAEESLATQNFLHQKIFYFPQSRSLAFTFYNGDLILAANLETLQKIATAIHVPEKRVAKSAGFRAITGKLNPRGNFIYATPSFLDDFFLNRFTGIQKALAAPLLNIWQAGGATFEATANGLQVQTQIVLKKTAITHQPFLEADEIDQNFLDFWGEDTKLFSANENIAAQIENFLNSGGAQNSTFATVAESLAGNLVHTWLGTNFTLAEISEIFATPSAVGLTESGGLVIIAESSLENIFEKLKAANGKIAATEKIVALPDTTPGRELTTENAPGVEEEIFASYKITTINFPQYALSFADLGDFSILSTEKTALENMVARAVGEEKFLPDQEPGSGNLIYVRVDAAENPFLQPFQFVLTNVNFESDSVSVRIDFSFEK